MVKLPIPTFRHLPLQYEAMLKTGMDNAEKDDMLLMFQNFLLLPQLPLYGRSSVAHNNKSPVHSNMILFVKSHMVHQILTPTVNIEALITLNISFASCAEEIIIWKHIVFFNTIPIFSLLIFLDLYFPIQSSEASLTYTLSLHCNVRLHKV